MSAKTKPDELKEYLALYAKVYKHGVEVFGSRKLFNKWLKSKNFYFDNKKPLSMMLKLDGLKFIDDKLTGMQYGDNA